MKRKTLQIGLDEFWEMDTFNLYTLLAWEDEVIENEPGPDGEPKQNPQGNKYGIEEDPETLDLYNKLTGRDLDD